ncbi:DsbA family protein [Maritimibacter sp. UBA3975]|uniref:DsbA family protein n=1 Tax=Maritimibacter sp. UBA3975 TaxID=1946833 RepID=UPI000C0982F9|nr:DsbA family protein [Maritimibacter sp. UBA3975]MAM63229.1 thiol-disulfide oxidoreductase [Maritimibacter sp.]|tara:strand:+ start:14443 stop:15123 length:681 start_codon:yes stop_codon:yes gene_type:complete
MNKILPIALGAAVLIGGGAFYTMNTGSTPGTSALSPVSPAVAQDATSEADIEPAEDMAIGDADAPVTMIEYASFTCPHCADFHERAWDDLKADYIDTGKVRFVNREVYFDKYGLWAGLVARCGGEMRYFGIMDMLFETQKDWIGNGQEAAILENLKTIGKKAGLSDDELSACLEDSENAQSMVAAYQQNAAEDEITGTPTFVINGEKYSNMTYADLQEILDGLIDG